MKLGYLTVLVATIAAGCAGTDELEYCEPEEGIECVPTQSISDEERAKRDRNETRNSNQRHN